MDRTQKRFDLKWCNGPALSPCKIWWKLPDARRRERTKCDVFHFVTGRICRRQLCRYCFYSRADFGVFRRGDTLHVAPIKVEFGTDGRSSVPNFTLIGSGVGVYSPQNWKKWNFTNIIAPKGRVPCTIFTKFTRFMRALSLHNFAKYSCFISINDKIINNLLRRGRFQPNFRRPLAAKLWMGPKMMARTTSITMQNLVEIALRTSEREDEMWCFSLFITAGSARRAALPVFRLLTGRFWGFSPRRGDTLHVAPIKVKFGKEPLLHAKFHLDRSRGGGLWPPKLKNGNFTNIIAPKGRVPCTIFTKFAVYMRVLSLYNIAKFGSITSINDKIINNLLRWGRFRPNFRRPLAAKLWTGSKNVMELKWWHRPPLSPCKIWWKSRDARRRERTKCDVFHFVFFENNALGRRPLWCVVELFPQDIALAFVGRFKFGLQRF